MLKRILIDRFKSIRRADLELGQINVFIGGNGTGKSNLLEAIGVVSAALARGVSDGDLTRKGVRLTPPELMKSAFKGIDLPKTLQVAVTMENQVQYRMHLTGAPDNPLLAFFSESCLVGQTRVFGRSNLGLSVLGNTLNATLDRHRSMWDQVRTAFDFPKTVQSALDQLSRYVIYAPQTDFLRGSQTGSIDSPPVGLRGEGLPGAVLGLIRQRGLLLASKKRELEYKRMTKAERTALNQKLKLKNRALNLTFLPGWARQFRVGRLDDYLTSRGIQNRGEDMVYFIDKFMHGRRNKLSAYDSSEGTLFLLFSAVVLAHDDAPRIFGFDNVDNALNPRTTRQLIETFAFATKATSRIDAGIGPKQVFLTSHHPSTLDAFDLFDTTQRVFVVDRDEAGFTSISRLRPQPDMTREDWDLAANGRRLSQLWMDGEIKGALGREVTD